MLVYRAEFLERDSVHSSFFFSLCEKYKGLLRCHDEDDNKNVKTQLVEQVNQELSRCLSLLLYISLP